jgi:type 1 glutamine amidotransferase
MIRRSKELNPPYVWRVNIVLFVALCLLLLTSSSQAPSPLVSAKARAVAGPELREVTPQEVQNIEKAVPERPTVTPARPRKLLVFWLCEGFFHKSIPVGNKALEILGKKTGAFETVITNDMSIFEPGSLEQFDAVCFNNTTGLKLSGERTPELCESLMNFVKGGKGIVGIHAATDNFNDWPEAMEMMGGKFTGHPWGADGTWAIKIDEPNHPLTKAFEGKGFKINDEIYRTEPPLYSRDKQLVLMSLDMSDPATRNVKGFKPTDADTGISWVKNWGRGRIFYCSLGHNDHIFWNPAVLRHYLDGIQFAFGDYEVDTKSKPASAKAGKPVISSGKGSEMDELLEKVKTYDWGQSRLALTEVSDQVRQAYGSPDELSRIEQGLLLVLSSDATPAGKQFVCRQLSIIGTERSVPALGKMLTGEETSDMARYALERIPGAAVDEALREALPGAKGKPKVGIINSLGQRRDKKAVPALAGLISDSDEVVAAAAAAALGRIADSPATKALAEAKDKTSGQVRMSVLDAYLRCADQFAAEGKKNEALAIYKELAKEEMPKPIRTAALRGVISVTKK